MTRWLPSIVVVVSLAGCTTAPAVPIAVAPPAAPVTVGAAMPAGGHAGMIIPAMLADGSYPTPNRALTGAAAVWHLRAGLNVAALACRGPEETLLVARYNALIVQHKAGLQAAEATLAAQYRREGGVDWRDRYDRSMTALYNFFSQSFARNAFCASADAVLADAATVPESALADFAAQRLPQLDRAFTDFYSAFDAWRGARLVVPLVMASASATAPRVAPPPVSPPRIEIDVAALDFALPAVAPPARLAANR